MKRKDNNSHKSLEEALIDLYLNVKIRKQDEVHLRKIKIYSYNCFLQ